MTFDRIIEKLLLHNERLVNWPIRVYSVDILTTSSWRECGGLRRREFDSKLSGSRVRFAISPVGSQAMWWSGRSSCKFRFPGSLVRFPEWFWDNVKDVLWRWNVFSTHGEESIAAIIIPSTLEGDLNLDEAVITFPHVSDAYELTGIITEIIQYKGGSSRTPESTDAQEPIRTIQLWLAKLQDLLVSTCRRSILLHTSLCPSSHESVFWFGTDRKDSSRHIVTRRENQILTISSSSVIPSSKLSSSTILIDNRRRAILWGISYEKDPLSNKLWNVTNSMQLTKCNSDRYEFGPTDYFRHVTHKIYHWSSRTYLYITHIPSHFGRSALFFK